MKKTFQRHLIFDFFAKKIKNQMSLPFYEAKYFLNYFRLKAEIVNLGIQICTHPAIERQRYFKKDAQVLFLVEKTQSPCKYFFLFLK